MLDEATTSEGTEETTSAPETSADTSETATEPTAKEASAQEGTTPKSEDSFNVAVDLESVPPAQRPFVERYVKQFEKQFKGEYTRKTQEAAAKIKAAELEAKNYREKYGMTENEVRAVLADPTKYEAYRKLYGFDKQAAAPQPEPKFQTVDELIAWNRAEQARVAQTATEQARAAAAEVIRQHETLSRWNTAVEKQRAADPKFSRYEQVVVKMAADPKYVQMYKGGMKEDDVLSAVYSDLKGLIRDDLDAQKKATLDALHKKKEATTVVPRKTVATTSTGGSKGKMNDAEVLARIEARLAGN